MSQRTIITNALGIGLATGAYGLSFGAVAIASGLDFWQTQSLSLFMFTGASQFAFVGVLGSGGGVIAAIITAILLGSRNGLYALHLGPLLRLRWPWRVAAAHITIDESTAMAIRYEGDRALARHAFWATGLSVFVLWNLGTALGALGASALDDPTSLGLDAAIPAAFLALLWPRLRDRQTWAVALAAAAVALLLTPWLTPGLPILAAAIIPFLVWRR